jgi:hypothetical protein
VTVWPSRPDGFQVAPPSDDRYTPVAPTAANNTGSTMKNDDSAIARTSPAGSPAPGPVNVVAPSFETSTPRAVAITSAGPGHSSRCTQVSRTAVGAKVRPPSGERSRPALVAANTVGSDCG